MTAGDTTKKTPQSDKEDKSQTGSRIRDRAAFALLLAMLIATTGSIGASFGGLGAGVLHDIRRFVSPEGPSQALEIEQRRQAQAIDRLEQSVRSLAGDVAAIEVMNLTGARSPALASADPARDGVDLRLAQAHIDIGALRASIDASESERKKDIVTITGRLDRVEAMLFGREATGSIGGAARFTTAASDPGAPATKPTRSRAPRSLAGWKIDSAELGRATLSHESGTFLATPGLTIPGLGRISAIRQRGDSWVVITQRGWIAQR